MYMTSLQWRHNGRQCVSNHQPHDCLLNRLFRARSKKTSKLRVTGLCVANSPGTGEFPTQMASNAENVSIWWRHHDYCLSCLLCSVVICYRKTLPVSFRITQNNIHIAKIIYISNYKRKKIEVHHQIFYVTFSDIGLRYILSLSIV